MGTLYLPPTQPYTSEGGLCAILALPAHSVNVKTLHIYAAFHPLRSTEISRENVYNILFLLIKIFLWWVVETGVRMV